MSSEDGRRVYLRVLLKLMAVLALFLLLRVLYCSQPARDADTEVRVTGFTVADMRPGDHQLVEWNEKPLFIVYRKNDWESLLTDAPSENYRDALSLRSKQPEDMKNVLRSGQAGWFVTLGIGTGSGCALVFKESDTQDQAAGFIDPCDKSRFDVAGRVYAKQTAKRNTIIPEWRLEGDAILVSE